MTNNKLAKLMGVTAADVAGFVDALRLQIAKGKTIEQAIEAHMKIMTAIVNNSVKFSQSESGRLMVVETFHPSKPEA